MIYYLRFIDPFNVFSSEAEAWKGKGKGKRVAEWIPLI